jgi:hypothetical protein
MAVPSMRLIGAFYAAAFRGEVGLWKDGRMSLERAGNAGGRFN